MSRMLYSYPGPFQFDGDGYDYIIVDEDKVEGHIEAGYAKTTTEAKNNYIEEYGEQDKAIKQPEDIKKLTAKIRKELESEIREEIEDELTAGDKTLSDADKRFNALVVVLDDVSADAVEFVAEHIKIEYTNKEDTIAAIKKFLGIE